MLVRVVVCCVLGVASVVPEPARTEERPLYHAAPDQGAPLYGPRRWDGDRRGWQRYPDRSARPPRQPYRNQIRPRDNRGDGFRRWPNTRFPRTFWVRFPAGQWATGEKQLL